MSESDHSDRGQCGPGDMSEDDDVAESVPLRRCSRLKRPAPHCTVCDSQIREECEGNVPGHSKRVRTCLACRVETDMAASSIFDEGRSRTSER